MSCVHTSTNLQRGDGPTKVGCGTWVWGVPMNTGPFRGAENWTPSGLCEEGMGEGVAAQTPGPLCHLVGTGEPLKHAAHSTLHTSWVVVPLPRFHTEPLMLQGSIAHSLGLWGWLCCHFHPCLHHTCPLNCLTGAPSSPLWSEPLRTHVNSHPCVPPDRCQDRSHSGNEKNPF